METRSCKPQTAKTHIPAEFVDDMFAESDLNLGALNEFALKCT